MSLYIDFPLTREDDAASAGDVVCSAWSKTESVLSVSRSEDGVTFYNEEGDQFENAKLERSNSDAVAMDWRPASKVVACGWEDGAVTLWNHRDKSLKEDSTVHTSRVAIVQWSPEGGRLLTADSNGTVAVWRTDYRGRLTLVCKRDIGNGADICCCAWLLSPEYRDSQRDLPSPPQQFIVGTKTGNVAMVNLKGELVASARLGSGLRTMNWFEEEQRLVLITDDCNMVQLRYQEGLHEFEQVKKVKLSMGSAATAAAGVSHAVWTSPGLLATCAPENVVRIWDLPNDASYFLRYDADANAGASREDAITSLSFNSRSRMLAASTSTGKIFLWRFIGEPASVIEEEKSDNNKENAASGEAKEDVEEEVEKKATPRQFRFPRSSQQTWEAVTILSALSSPILGVGWGPRECSLYVLMGQGQCSIMNETTLHRTLRADVAALQVSAQQLLVQRGGSIRIENKCGLRIKGVDVSDSHVLVWNQKKAEVYEFQDDDKMQRLVSFPCKAESMALNGETLFQTNGSQLEVCNLQGVPRKTIAFTEVEGEPRLLHANGKFLAVATTKGFLRVYDVSRREPRAIGSGRRFVEQQRSRSGKVVKAMPIGEIKSISCNCDGTRVSVVCDVVKGQYLCEPDTRLHVWNTEIDELQSFDFGPERYPISHFWDSQEPKLLTCEARRVSKCINSFDDTAARKKFLNRSSDRALRGSRLRHTDDDDDFSQVKRVAAEKLEEDEEKKRLQQMRISRRGNSSSSSSSSSSPFEKDDSQKDVAEIEVVTLFATNERSLGVMMQDSFPLEPSLDALIGIKVPRLFFISKATNGEMPRLKGRTMRDFVGIDTEDGEGSASRAVKVSDETKRALIDFSYYLTIGNMDEAYRAVRLIQNVSVWENMAHMCVKTRRLDVAEMCMGNMGHARGAAALRESKRTAPENPNAQIAAVAVQLGLLDDAERLYMDCGRFDLLNKMLRASGQWAKALEVANSFDRIHLRETHFAYGRHLESVQDWNAAIANYEASGTHRKQVPRMLFEANRIEELESYVQSQCDEELTQWWGQYCESIGEYERAIKVYQRGEDDLSLVRVYCHQDNLSAAAEVALGSSNAAASYHLARQCEQRGDVQEAIQFYSRAGRYNHAVRLAKESCLDREIVNLALRASRSTMLDAARYLESRGVYEDAVVLFQKGGNIPRALDLCFRAELFDLLGSIADNLSLPSSGSGSNNNSSDVDNREEPHAHGKGKRDDNEDDARAAFNLAGSSEILSRCAEFFIQHRKFDKAVNLYITAGEFETALELCFNQKVMISEEMAESMTLEKLAMPSKKDAGKAPSGMSAAKVQEHNERRQQLLISIAKCCKKQQSYHLATKKYTQAGDRLKAMKCLLRSGDTEKIIFFAGVSRNKDIYILAANYLQNLDWRNDPEIMKSIISYYTKAKAFKQLSAFYESCGQFEIDEFRDYSKALGAFKEAVKYLGKIQVVAGDTAAVDEKDEQLMSLQQRISLVERFVHAQKLIVGDPEEASRVCNSLLAHPDVGQAIRVGDVFSMLVNFQHKNRNMEAAYQLVDKMKARGVSLAAYIDRPILDDISRAVGMDLVDDERRKGFDSADEIDDEIADEIEEEIWSHK